MNLMLSPITFRHRDTTDRSRPNGAGCLSCNPVFDRQHDVAITVRFKKLPSLLGTRLGPRFFFELVSVDADRKHAQVGNAHIVPHLRDLRIESRQVKNGSDEVSHVGKGVESDLIGTEQSFNQLAPRMTTKDFERRKWRVQKNLHAHFPAAPA